MEIEIDNQSRSSPLILNKSTHDRLLISPYVELSANGSLYHPNLLEFNFNTWQSLSRNEVSLVQVTESGTFEQKSSDNLPLIRYDASASIMKHKPYSIRLHATNNRTVKSYDFYTTSRTDTQSYGIRTGYRSRTMPVEVSYSRLSETEDGLNRKRSRNESHFKFKAQHKRENNNQTLFNYSHTDWDRRYGGPARETGSTELATITNKAYYGQKDQAILDTNLRYSRTTSQLRSNKVVQGRISLGIEHSDDLRSRTNIIASRTSSGDTKQNLMSLSAGLTHHLFNSLTSSLEVFGSKDQSKTRSGGLDLKRYGFGWSEKYRKKIGKVANLHLSYALRYQPQTQSFEGKEFMVLDELHKLSDDKIVLLDMQGVILSSVSVTDQNGSVLFIRGIDYLLISQGASTEIRRIVGGDIRDGQEIRVNYRAMKQESGEVTTTSHSASWQLNLWNSKLRLFGRYSNNNAEGDDSIVVDEFRTLLLGLESQLGWLNIGMEYEDRESTITPYTAIRLKQSIDWQPAGRISTKLTFTETRRTFPGLSRSWDYLDCIGRMEIALSRYLRANLAAGYRIESGDGIDHSMITSSLSITYQLGKLSAMLQYRYQSRSFYADQFGRHFLQFSAKRKF
jgi:hypothetical protein